MTCQLTNSFVSGAGAAAAQGAVAAASPWKMKKEGSRSCAPVVP